MFAKSRKRTVRGLKTGYDTVSKAGVQCF